MCCRLGFMLPRGVAVLRALAELFVEAREYALVKFLMLVFVERVAFFMRIRFQMLGFVERQVVPSIDLDCITHGLPPKNR